MTDEEIQVVDEGFKRFEVAALIAKRALLEDDMDMAFIAASDMTTGSVLLQDALKPTTAIQTLNTLVSLPELADRYYAALEAEGLTVPELLQ